MVVQHKPMSLTCHVRQMSSCHVRQMLWLVWLQSWGMNVGTPKSTGLHVQLLLLLLLLLHSRPHLCCMALLALHCQVAGLVLQAG